MKFLKVLFSIVLAVVFVHLIFHIYYLATPYGIWYNENGNSWDINSLEYTYTEVYDQSVLIDNDTAEKDEVMGNAFILSNMNSRAEYTPSLGTVQTWYRCPFCTPQYFYNYLQSK